MASIYSPSLKLTLMGDGDQSGIWGQTTNTNLGTLLEQAITGVQSITMSDANYTLTSFNGVTDEARNAVLVVTGTNNATRDLIPPVVEKLYIVFNNTTGGQVVRVIGTTGTGVNIPNGTYSIVYCDGTNFVQVLNSNNIAGSLSVSGATTLANALTYGGVTLSNAVTGTGSMVLSASPTFTGTPQSTTASPGTNTTQIATTAFVTAAATAAFPSGGIIMWSGSIASIPSGWLLCNGSSGTPDLRDRFVVGAGSTYAVNATGGNANATLPSHTHTATSTVTDPGHLHDTGQFDSGSFAFSPATSGTTSNRATTASAFTGITVTTTNSTEGSSATGANLPPYYALAYIMKA